MAIWSTRARCTRTRSQSKARAYVTAFRGPIDRPANALGVQIARTVNAPELTARRDSVTIRPMPNTARPRRMRRRHAVRSLSNVRVSEDAYGDLSVAANRRGLTNAAYVRMVLLAEIEREKHATRTNESLPTSPIAPPLGIAPAGVAPAR